MSITLILAALGLSLSLDVLLAVQLYRALRDEERRQPLRAKD